MGAQQGHGGLMTNAHAPITMAQAVLAAAGSHSRKMGQPKGGENRHTQVGRCTHARMHTFLHAPRARRLLVLNLLKPAAF